MKKILSLALALVMILALAACGQEPGSSTASADSGSQNASTSAKPDKTYTLRIGHILDTESIRQQYLERFAKEVEEKTNGGIKVEIYPSAELGTDDELIEQVKNGSIEGYSGSAIDTNIPDYNFYSMPFLFANVDEAIAVMNSEWGQNWAKASEKNGTIVLATGACGFRNLTNSKRVVKTPADLNGIKLRVPSWEVTIKTMEALGVSCTSIAYNETYQALKTGVADGQENPWAYIVSPKFYEVQKYATVLNWNLTLEYFPINKAWFDALPADYQKIVKDAATSAMEWFNQANKDAEKGYIDLCAQYMEITELTPEEHQAFVDATASVYDYYIQKGLFTQQDLDTVRGIIAASKK